MSNTGGALFNIDFILNKLNIEEKNVVAELGCGNFGFFVWPMAKRVGKHGIVYAVDIIKSILRQIQSQATKDNMPQVKTVWSNLEIFKATNIETNSLDNALLINVLHQSGKRTEIIREAIRLLKRGGKLLIAEWKNEDLPLGPPLESRVKKESIIAAAPRLGLDLREEFDAGPYHYGLILTKL